MEPAWIDIAKVARGRANVGARRRDCADSGAPWMLFGLAAASALAAGTGALFGYRRNISRP
jgi:hypothetical protein